MKIRIMEVSNIIQWLVALAKRLVEPDLAGVWKNMVSMIMSWMAIHRAKKKVLSNVKSWYNEEWREEPRPDLLMMLLWLL